MVFYWVGFGQTLSGEPHHDQRGFEGSAALQQLAPLARRGSSWGMGC